MPHRGPEYAPKSAFLHLPRPPPRLFATRFGVAAGHPPSRAAALAADAPAARRGSRRARQPGDHAGPARSRRLGSPSRHVALLDLVRQDPAPSAAVLQGLFFGRIAPHRTERRTFEAPGLVIGHRRDPVHPFSDAGMLADELPHGRLLEAESIVELRFSPDRLTD